MIKRSEAPTTSRTMSSGPMQPYGNYPQSLLDTFRVKSLLSPDAHLKTEDAPCRPAGDRPRHRLRGPRARLARGVLHNQGDR